jgi:hypothetical protein
VVVIADDAESDAAEELYAAAVAPFAFGKATLRLKASQVAAENLPPALAETIPNLPQLRSGRSFAVLCSGRTCEPPVFEGDALRKALLRH